MKKYINLFLKSLVSTMSFYTANYVISHEQAIEGLKSINFFTYNFHRAEINYASAYGLNASIFFVLLLFFYNQTGENIKNTNKKANIISTIFGILFSIIITIGHSFINTNSFDLIFYNLFQFVISVINLIGYYFLFKSLFLNLIEFTNRKQHNIEIKKYKNKFEKLYENHPVLICFIIFIICWIPYIVIFYPGMMNYDSLVEINQFYGVKEWTTHHPIIPTIIYGIFMKIGQKILNDSFGLFINNICQIIVGGLVISYSINNIYNLTKNEKIRKILIIIFALFPIWIIHLYTEVKDVGFFIGVLLYINILMIFVDRKEKIKLKEYILYITSMILIYFFRNNGIYLILLTIPFLFLLKNKENRNKAIIISFLVIIVCYSINLILMKTLNISKGSIKEAMAIPLQQTARYIITYDLNEEEKNDIEKLIEIDNFKNYYNPESIDIVKQNFKKDVSKEELFKYLIQWYKMFLKHPDVYISATLNSTYGYIYPDRKEQKDGIAQFSIDTFSGNIMNLQLNLFNNSHRYIIESFLYMLRNLPFFGLLFSCGFYNWILIICTLLLIYYKKIQEIIPLVPLYIVMLVCIASPVNAYLRYMLPTIFSMPFIICWSQYVILKEKRE